MSGNLSVNIKNTIKDYFILIKFTLSFTVVFSCVICFLLAPNIEMSSWSTIKNVCILFVAGMMVTGSANAINQASEKDSDAQMKRTANRPVAAGRMTVQHALTIAAIIGITGTIMMWYYFNLTAAIVSLFSLFLYAYIYTPLKKKNSIAVLIGGFPGALPCLIGWVAATDVFNPYGTIMIHNVNISNMAGWSLFLLQFVWQFPHFWAIAWVAHNDYSRVGFKLLPSDKGPTKYTAIQTIMYSVLLIPIGFLPSYFGVTGHISMWIILLGNLVMVMQSVRLYNTMDVKAARRVMFSSYIYLPIILMALLFDKIHY